MPKQEEEEEKVVHAELCVLITPEDWHTNHQDTNAEDRTPIRSIRLGFDEIDINGVSIFDSMLERHKLHYSLSDLTHEPIVLTDDTGKTYNKAAVIAMIREATTAYWKENDYADLSEDPTKTKWSKMAHRSRFNKWLGKYIAAFSTTH